MSDHFRARFGNEPTQLSFDRFSKTEQSPCHIAQDLQRRGSVDASTRTTCHANLAKHCHMSRLSLTIIYRGTVVLIWALALWHSWVCRGLFIDGSQYLIQIVKYQWFCDFDLPRLYAIVVTQLPVVAAIQVGITDLHRLAQFQSLGLFALPTCLYHLALWRARRDPVLLACVIAAISIVFMPTSFFIVGEYNTVYAIAVASAVWLATTERLQFGGGLAIAMMAALSIRCYEATIYLGPLLAAMTIRTAWRTPTRPLAPTLLHLTAAMLFAGGMVVAFESLSYPGSDQHRQHWDQALLITSALFSNIQFDLVLAGAVTVVMWGFLKPLDLMGQTPYRWGIAFLAALAASPLLAFGDTLIRPMAKSHYGTRMIAGVVVVAIVGFIWCQSERAHWRVKLLMVLRQAEAGRRLCAFAALMFVASIPADVLLTINWISFLDTLRATVRAQDGIVAFEGTRLSRRPYVLLVESWVLPTQSLVVRSKAGAGILAPPKDFSAWMPFPLSEQPNIGDFVWRD